MNNSTVAITGHTRGIGKALAEVFQASNYTIQGFSKSTGFDIANPQSRSAIIDQSNNANIFINNAFDPVGQLALLQELTVAWSGSDKLIINISSKGAFVSNHHQHNLYNKAKQAQNEFVRSRILYNSPRILNIIVGVVDTELTNQWKCNKIEPQQLASMIFQLSTSPIFVQEIILDAPKVDWFAFN
jgi:NAD(P)-dependent dehydrogenase (short-subunit alcohol dehydrogenase family)